jgi:hypothetical protein
VKAVGVAIAPAASSEAAPAIRPGTLNIERTPQMRKVRILGIAVGALLAVSSALASIASADDFTAEKYPATLTGKNTKIDKLTVTVGTVGCQNSSYVATVTGATTTLTITPSYSSCTAFGFPATIDMNGCQLIGNIGAGTTGDGDISCPAGQSITITAISAGTNKCTLHIESQADLTGVITFVNKGSGTTREVELSGTLTGVDYSHTKGTGLGACAAGTATNGSIEMSALVTGEEDPGSGHIGIFLS